VANIDLDCPKCGARLQIDESFAGSVCRCSDCGQVMKVPARAEASPQGARPDAPGQTPPPAAKVQAAPSSKSPVAKFAVAIAIVLLTALVGLFYFAKSIDHGEDADPPGSILGYDATVNPFILANANFFGVPIEGRVAVVIDASSSSREWLPLAKDVIVDAAEKIDAASSVQFVFWSESPPPPMYPDDGPAGAIDAQGLADFLDTVRARGLAEPGPALEAALSFAPKRVILVCGRPLDDEQIAALPVTDVRIDALVIDADAPQLTQWIEQRGGACARIPLSQLREWHADASPDW
jgi:hypothetical protein